MIEAQSLAGRLLLAMPGMPDPRFEEAVLALCMHDKDGALGIGVGRCWKASRCTTCLMI
jgi:putative transcriptional regulator